jgi:group I intron endonuclease
MKVSIVVTLFVVMRIKQIKSNWETAVYQIRNIINEETYIGSAAHSRQRFYTHKNLLSRNNHHCTKLQEAWNIYGKENFEFSILERCSVEDRVEREQYYMDLFLDTGKGNLLYNTSHCARSGGNALLGKKKDPDAVRRSAEGNRGKKRTKEQIEAKRLVVGKEYSAVDPEGKVHHFKNLMLFSEQNGLNFRNFEAMIKGRRRSHRKWTSGQKWVPLGQREFVG